MVLKYNLYVLYKEIVDGIVADRDYVSWATNDSVFVGVSPDRWWIAAAPRSHEP